MIGLSLTGFFKTKISTAAGLIIIVCAAASTTVLITTASAAEVWPDYGFAFPIVQTAKANTLPPNVLGEAVKDADNKPVCIEGNCYYYQISNLNIPDSATNNDKKIIVSLNDQELVYLEGTKVIGSFKISSGLAHTPSPEGEFEILVKKPTVNYVGAGYSYRGTKWNLLFKPNAGGNFYIHGTYWHNNFGRPMSHGCINVSYENMEALYNWADVGTKVIIQVQPIIPFADGTLVLDASDGKTIYIIDSGEKRGFTSREVFQGLGYDFSQMVKSNLSGYPEGLPVSSIAAPHPAGTLVKYETELYKIAVSGKKLIPNENVFKSWGWVATTVVEANSADLDLPNLGNVKYREGAIIEADDGTTQVVSNGRLKRFIKSDLN